MSLLAAAFNSERFEQMELAPMTWRRLPGGNEPLLRAKREGGVAFAVVGHGRAGRRSWRCTRKSDQLLVVCCCHGNRPQRRCSSGITHSLRHTSSPLPVRPRHNHDNLLYQIPSLKTLATVFDILSLVLSHGFTTFVSIKQQNGIQCLLWT